MKKLFSSFSKCGGLEKLIIKVDVLLHNRLPIVFLVCLAIDLDPVPRLTSGQDLIGPKDIAVSSRASIINATLGKLFAVPPARVDEHTLTIITGSDERRRTSKAGVRHGGDGRNRERTL
jgi:hypothetical protein